MSYLIFDLLAMVPFLFPENDFYKFLFVFKYFSFSELLNSHLKTTIFRASILIKFTVNLLLAIHFCSNSWIFFLMFEKESKRTWFNQMELYEKNNFSNYIYSLKWTFHIFLPFISIPFECFNEYEIVFEIISMICAGLFILWNLDLMLFLFHEYFQNVKVLEKMNILTNFIRDCEKNGKKRTNLIEKSLVEAKKENVHLMENDFLDEVTNKFYGDLMKNIITPIIFEKIPFFFLNFSKEFLVKLIPLFKFKRYNEGDELIEVYF